ncbi:MAG TPA: AMP-binding protein [Ilumatobacteraceae bacterium]|nr:AMP-binding protein [Ilumatobacteraceae bacterium]
MYPGEHAKDHPDEPALIMEPSGAQLTFAEYEANCNRLAHLFRAAGLQRGDHVAMFLENNLRYFELQGAAERAGLYYTCVNSYLTADEVAYIVDDCQARVFFTSAARADVAVEATALTPDVEVFLAIDTDHAIGPFQPYDAALAEHPATPIADEQLGAAMLYSSGTTGRPKGILRPLPDVPPGAGLALMDFIKQMFRFREGMRYLSPAPLYHSAPQASVSATMRLGGTSVIMERFDPEQYLALVERHRITHSQVVPTMFSRMLKQPVEVRTRYDLSSLETVIHAAAPCPVQVKQDMIEWFGPKIIEYYGATEANGFTWCDSEEWLAHPGTVGHPIAGRLLILDDEGNEVPTGTPGTVWFDGATNFTYWRDPDKTAESRNASGTASTVGDVGYVDDEGYLYLTDRKTYMIISGGVNIYPQETENLLITHPKVMDAAVIGVPNEDLGEEVKAVVQVVDGIEPGPALEQELLAFCRANLAHFKCPRTVDFEAELPRLPTGKLYKRLLRDRYWGNTTSKIV